MEEVVSWGIVTFLALWGMVKFLKIAIKYY